MQKAHCEIKGLTPYYYTKYTGEKPGKGEKAEKEFALKMVYCNGAGLYFPGIQIQGCLINAIGLTKMKIEGSMKRAVDYMHAGFNPPEIILFSPKMNLDNIELVQERTNIGRDQVKMVWYSRISTEWGAKFDLEFVDVLPAPFIGEALKTAGQYCAIGGRRNWKRGIFEVVKYNLA